MSSMVFPAWKEFKKLRGKTRVRIEVKPENEVGERPTKAWYMSFIIALFEEFDGNIDKMSKWFRKKGSDEDLSDFLIIKKQIEEDPKLMYDFLSTYEGLLRQTERRENGNV